MLPASSKNRSLKRVTASFLVMFAALAVSSQLRTTNAQKLEGHPPYTLVMRVTDSDAKGEVLSAHTSTRYYSATGDWRAVGNFRGYEMATVYRRGRGVYTSNARTGVLIKNSDHAPGCALRSADQLRRDPKFARTEIVLGFEAYVMSERLPVGYFVETFFIPELGGGTPVKRVYSFDDGRKMAEEPLSITPGEPAPADVSGPDYRVFDQTPIFDQELAGKIVSRPDPIYPPEALARRIVGAVEVSVLVDESGRVVSARLPRPYPFLQEAAVEAAYDATFLSTTPDGGPRLVKGVIHYRFVLLRK